MSKLLWEQDFLQKGASLQLWNKREGNDLLDNEGQAVCPGWGNGEQQFYTGREQNVYLDQEGLHLRACVETTEAADGRSFAYTSARIDTRDLFSFCYGRLVIRAKLPAGQGLWPAIWLMPQDQTYGGWPASGEIDIVEARGRLPQQVSGTLHYGGSFENKQLDEYSLHLTDSSITDYHDYALEWRPDAIRWEVDGHCYAEKQLDPATMPFDQPFYLLLNVAVGGWYDHVAVDEAAFPAEMVVAGIWLYE